MTMAANADCGISARTGATKRAVTSAIAAVTTSANCVRAPAWTLTAVTEMDAQTARILDFCNQSAPECIVHVMPVGPDSFRLRVKDGGDVLIDSDVALYTPDLAAKSDDDLWELLENVSRQRIKRK